MLTAAIVSTDPNSSAQLLASVQQTGLVTSVRQWLVPTDRLNDPNDIAVDVILLDLPKDPEPCFSFGSQARRMHPAARLIACSATMPPTPQLLMDAMRCGVQEFVSKPAVAEELKSIFVRFTQESPVWSGYPTDKFIAVMGSKGGVGTTTVAVNLGVQLSSHMRKKTVLLDLARPLGNAHLMLDVHPRFGIRDAIDNLDRLDSHFFEGLLERHKTKLELLGGSLQPEEWQHLPMASIDRVVNVAQSSFEVVLADVGSFFSTDLSQILRGARLILIVVEANVPSLWTLQRRLLALSGFGIDSERIRLVVNRWHKGDEEALKSIEKDSKRPIFGCISNDFRKASTAVNLGAPLMDNNNNNVLTTEYRKLAEQLVGSAKPALPKKTGLSSFFSLSKS
jgi:pilus assembly protein CpaE